MYLYNLFYLKSAWALQAEALCSFKLKKRLEKSNNINCNCCKVSQQSSEGNL